MHGDFWSHEYEITSAGRMIASVSKEWLTWGDTYGIQILNDADVLNVLSVVLVIDACIAAQRNN